MSTHFISVRRNPSGLFSVDISDNPHRGGSCRLFRFIDDGEIWIKEITGRDIPGKWPNLNQRNFEVLGDFKSWDESTWR